MKCSVCGKLESVPNILARIVPADCMLDFNQALGLSLGYGHYVVFLDKTIQAYSASLLTSWLCILSHNDTVKKLNSPR